RSQFGKRQRITDDDTQQVDQVADGKRQAIGVDVGGGDLRLPELRIWVERAQAVEEIVGEEHGVGDLIGNAIEVEVAPGIDRIGADDVDAAVPEVDKTNRLVLLADIAVGASTTVGDGEVAAQVGDFEVRIDEWIGVLELKYSGGNPEGVATDVGESIIAAVDPDETDRHVLALERLVSGDK